MTNHELAFDEDGEPFGVPPQVAGWRVRRAADGRGRPALIHGRGSEKGKPLIVRANASHAELLAAAGPGRYRLEAVDEHRHKVEGVPVACTGPLSADEDGTSEDDASTEMHGGSAVRQGATSYEDVLCTVVTANTRMVEKALGQMGSVMASVAELLNAAHNAGITSRLPPSPPPPPPPPPPPVESPDDEDDEETGEEEEAEEAAPSSGLPDVLQLVIKEAIAKVVPLIFEKLTSGAGLGGLPLEAILDWRKAVPNPAAAPSAPAAPVAPAAPTTPAPASVPSAPSWLYDLTVPAAPVQVNPASLILEPCEFTPASTASHAATTPASSPPATAPAGAAPSRESPPGAAPAEMPTPPAASSPRTQEDAAAMLNAHVLQVWQGLSPPERARAGQLIARLTAEERTAWIAELATFTVPEAIARARAVLHGQPPPTPPTPQLPTTTTQGDPS